MIGSFTVLEEIPPEYQEYIYTITIEEKNMEGSS